MSRGFAKLGLATPQVAEAEAKLEDDENRRPLTVRSLCSGHAHSAADGEG